MPGSNSRPNVSEGCEVPLSYRGDRLKINKFNLSYLSPQIKEKYSWIPCSMAMLAGCARCSIEPNNLAQGMFTRNTKIMQASEVPSTILQTRKITHTVRGTKFPGNVTVQGGPQASECPHVFHLFAIFRVGDFCVLRLPLYLLVRLLPQRVRHASAYPGGSVSDNKFQLLYS